MARKTHTEAQARYDKLHRRVYGFRLHNDIDSDIIAKLTSEDSMQGYIKQLIREDIARTRIDSVPKSVPKKTMSIDKLYDWLQGYADINYNGSLYDVINALSSKLMGHDIDE